MRLNRLAWALPLAFAVASVSAACSADDSGDAADASFDGARFGTGSDGGEPPVDAGASAPTLFRFAHLSPGLGALDLCYRVGTTDAFIGPIFAPLAPSADAGESMQDASDASSAV